MYNILIKISSAIVLVVAIVFNFFGNLFGMEGFARKGDAIGREDITYLAPLPLFDKNGNPLN